MDSTEQTVSPSGGGSKSAKLIIILIIAIVIVLAGGVFAYGKFVKKANSITEILNPTKYNPNCKYNDPDLCKFINNWKDVKNLAMNTVTTDKGGKKSTWILKMSGDTTSQMISSSEGKEDYNVITIGDTSYTKDYTDNKWFKYTYKKDQSSELVTEESKIQFDDKADNVEDKTTYKKIGTEACGDLTCFKYQVVDPAMVDLTEYIYFDNKEYTLRKTRDEGKDGSVSESTLDYSKVTISEPSPIKEGSPYDSALTNQQAQDLLNSASSSSSSASSTDTSSQTTTPTLDTSDTSSTSTSDSSSIDIPADGQPVE